MLVGRHRSRISHITSTNSPRTALLSPVHEISDIASIVCAIVLPLAPTSTDCPITSSSTLVHLRFLLHPCVSRSLRFALSIPVYAPSCPPTSVVFASPHSPHSPHVRTLQMSPIACGGALHYYSSKHAGFISTKATSERVCRSSRILCAATGHVRRASIPNTRLGAAYGETTRERSSRHATWNGFRV